MGRIMAFRRLFGAAVTAAVALMPAMAEAAAPQPCLTQGEFTGLVGYALPGVLDAAAQNCGALPANAYLKANRAAIAAQYAPYKQTAWVGAKAAVVKIVASFSGASGIQATNGAQLMAALPDPVLQALVDGFVPQMISARIKPRDCALIDHLARLVAPMPAQNTSELFALIVVTEMSDKIADISPLRFCPS